MKNSEAMMAAEDKHIKILGPYALKFSPMDFRAGWQAACEWRDSQVGEPYAYIYEFDSKQFGVRRSFSSNQWNGLNPSRCVLVYTTPPAAQINQQLVEALDSMLLWATATSEALQRQKRKEVLSLAQAALNVAKSGDV